MGNEKPQLRGRNKRNAGCLVLIMAVFFLRQDARILRKYQQPLLSLENLSNALEIGVPYYETPNGYDEEYASEDDENTAPKISQKPQRSRPYLILHVGPPKTATTTFQQGFFENREALGRDDNLMYVGQPPKARQPRITSWQDDNNHTETTLISYPMKSLTPFPKKDACKHIKHHLKHNRNVVLSTEHYTSHWFMGTNIQSTPQASRFLKLYDLLFLQQGANSKCKDPARYKVNPDENAVEQVWNDDTSHQFAFDVKIVVTYRHYFEWLPSFYYQWELVNHPNNVPTLRQFIEDALDKLPPHYFEIHDDSNTNLWDHDAFSAPQRVHGPLYSYLRWSSPAALRNRVELFDLHQQKFGIDQDDHQQEEHGLFTKLICQSIPAPNLCQNRRNDDAANIKEQRVRVKTNSRHVFRTGLLNDMLVKQIHSKARDYFPELKRNKTEVPRTYNFDPAQNIYLTKEMQRPNPNFRPVELNFYYWAQQQNKTKQHEDKVLCLSQQSLDRFRVASWNMLVQLHYLARQSSHDHYVVDDSTLLDHPLLLAPHIPAAANTNIPSRDDWQRLQQAHDDAFWEASDAGIYCELDWEALMDDEEFVETVFYSQSYDKISARKRLEIKQHLGIKRPTR